MNRNVQKWIEMICLRKRCTFQRTTAFTTTNVTCICQNQVHAWESRHGHSTIYFQLPEEKEITIKNIRPSKISLRTLEMLARVGPMSPLNLISNCCPVRLLFRPSWERLHVSQVRLGFNICHRLLIICAQPAAALRDPGVNWKNKM